MTDVKPELPDPPACPLLGLVADSATHFSFPHAGHRCRATRTPSTIDLPHQTRYCLGADFEHCDRYLARADRQTDKVVAATPAAEAAGTLAALDAAAQHAGAPASASTAAQRTPDWPPAAPVSPVAPPVDAPEPPPDSPEAPGDEVPRGAAAESDDTRGMADQAPARLDGAAAPDLGPTAADAASPEPDGAHDAPAPRASWTLYPPNPDSGGIVRPRAPRTWRQTSAGPVWSESTATTRTRSVTARAVRLVRGIAVIVVLLLVLFVAAYLAAGTRLGLGGSGPSPSSSGAAAVAASAASTGLASAATSAPVASSAPAQSAAVSTAPSASPAPARTPRGTSVVHVVRSGETLQGIATEYGVTVQQIVTANKLKDPNVIVAGERLVIPAPSKAP